MPGKRFVFASLSVLALSEILTACSDEPKQAVGGTEPAAIVANAAQIVPCALQGATAYVSECAVERHSEDGKTVLVIRHPDGGFRRLEELDGGRSYASADGADKTEVAVDKDRLAITVEQDHYLMPLPSSMKPPAPTPAADAAAR